MTGGYNTFNKDKQSADLEFKTKSSFPVKENINIVELHRQGFLPQSELLEDLVGYKPNEFDNQFKQFENTALGFN